MPEGTLAEIKEQIELSKLSGGMDKVKTKVSQTGTRDAASATIIEHLLELGKHLRKREAGKVAIPEAEVCMQLEQEFEALLRDLPLDNHINPLFSIPGLNVHQDTPTEILHTILLGVVKYYWGQTVYILDKARHLSTFQMRLDSVEKGRLGPLTLVADYIIHYKGMQTPLDSVRG